MAFDSNKIMTYSDLKWLVDNENFKEKNSFNYISKKGVTKQEALDSLQLQEAGLEIAGYLSNQLVPRRVLIPDNYSLLCNFDITTATPNEDPSITGWVKEDSTATISRYGVAFDGINSLYLTGGNSLIISNRAYKDYPFVKGRNYEVSFWFMKEIGTNQSIEFNPTSYEIFNIPTTWTSDSITFTSSVNAYGRLSIVARAAHQGTLSDNIFIDKVLIKEYPYDLYPAGNAASINNIGTPINEEEQNASSWAIDASSEATGNLSAITPGTNGSWAIRSKLYTDEVFPVLLSIISSIEVKDGRELEFSFDARVNIATIGAAEIIVRQYSSIFNTTVLTKDNAWHSYTFTVTPTYWESLSIYFELTGNDQDYIDFDNFKIVQLPC